MKYQINRVKRAYVVNEKLLIKLVNENREISDLLKSI